MEASLNKHHSIVFDEIDEAMLIVQATRPSARPQPLQRLGLPDANKRISQDCLDEI
jgi:hypothetical protein